MARQHCQTTLWSYTETIWDLKIFVCSAVYISENPATLFCMMLCSLPQNAAWSQDSYSLVNAKGYIERNMIGFQANVYYICLTIKYIRLYGRGPASLQIYDLTLIFIHPDQKCFIQASLITRTQVMTDPFMYVLVIQVAFHPHLRL